MLKEVFKVISFYDRVRWSHISNYNLINFYKSDLDDDTKILTHWLCYISDRQMPFKRIWDIGGFVFSELVHKFKEEKDFELLKPNKENSFFTNNRNGGYVFTSNTQVNDNQILLKSYGYSENDVVKFTPRYYPSDYYSIFFTFYLLSKYNYSLTRFIAEQIIKFKGRDDLIPRILFSLYLLTYFAIGQPNKADLENFESNLELAKERAKKIFSILNDNEKFEKELDKFKKVKIFNQKRAWCCLRDFFKSPEFNGYFRKSLEKENIDTSKLFTLKYFQQFELPGDVWNNNSKFRKCIFENTGYETSNKSLNRILREFFEENKSELNNCYPEQFDITFDFVPRMCESDNCDICPIGLIKGKTKSNFKKTCVQNKNFYCSVSLINCNYKTDCIENKCEIINVIR